MPIRRYDAIVLRADDPGARISTGPLSVQAGTRPLVAIAQHVRERYGLDIVLLDWHDEDEGGAGAVRTAVLEALNPQHGRDWTRGHRVAARQAGRFSECGWIHVLRDWLSACGLSPLGPVRQVEGSASSCVLAVDTAAGPIWYKAPPPDSCETAVTCAIARTHASVLPPMLAVHQAWGGWVSAHVPGQHLTWEADERRWRAAVRTLATLQRDSTERSAEFLALGARDLRVVRLRQDAASTLDALARTLDASERAGLARAWSDVERALDELGATPCPDTLTHNDWGPHNIMTIDEDCWMLDWAGAAVAPAFATWCWFAGTARRHLAGSHAIVERLHATMCDVWSEAYARPLVERVMRVSPLIAAVAYAARFIPMTRDPHASAERRAGATNALRAAVRVLVREAERSTSSTRS